MTPSADSTRQLAGGLSASKIVVMVVAAAAPMGAVLGIIPMAFALAGGPATPVAYLIAGATLLLFSIGYSAMSRRISTAGAFYVYVAKGLGRIPAVGASYLAIIAYNATALTIVAGLGYFGDLIIGGVLGVSVPWVVYALAGAIIIALFGYRQVDLAARVLTVLLVLEVGALIVLDLAMVVHKGWAAFPLEIFAPDPSLNLGTFGLAAMFAFQCFIGFESTALYREEAKNPRKSIPRATYTSVGIITVFYFLTTWITVGAVGTDEIRSFGADNAGDMYFVLSSEFASESLTAIMQVVLLTSLLASLLALHNASSRYMFNAGREGLLPRWIGVPHRTQGTPSRASLVQTGINVVVILIFAIIGADPYYGFGTTMTGLGTLGILLLQVLAALAIMIYFITNREKLIYIVAPALALIVFSVVVALTISNFSILTQMDSWVVNVIPWALFAVALLGMGYGLWLRTYKPRIYAQLGEGPESETLRPVHTPASHDGSSPQQVLLAGDPAKESAGTEPTS